MLTIYYGRESVDKEKFIFDNIKGRALIIVPDQFTLEAERELFKSLGVTALLDVEVLSMSRLGYRLLSELGGSKRTFIDKYGRHMILAQTALEERENLQVFRGLEGKSSFIDMVNNFITDMKQNNCCSAELGEMAAQVEEGSYVQKKLQDLQLLLSRYEEKIDGKYTDSEDYISLVLDKISRSRLISGNNIWFYGFDSFTPKALSIMGELMANADEVKVVLTGSEDLRERDSEIFELSRRVMDMLTEEARSRGIAATRKEIPAAYAFAGKAPAMSHIEGELYALPAKAAGQAEGSEGLDKGLTLLSASGPYSEAESAACFVQKLVRDKGYRYSDIKVICNDQDVRGPILKRIFREYGMELFSDARKDIMQSPVLQFVISLLDVVIEKYRSEALFRMLKSGFGDLTSDEITDLENYGIKYRIKGTMWKRHFVKGEREYGPEELERLDWIRSRAVAPVEGFEVLMKSGGSGEAKHQQTNREFVDNFYRYLYDDARLPERILSFMEEQTAAGRQDLSEETAQIWGCLVHILDQISEISGDDKFIPQNFRDLLKTGLSQMDIGLLPPAKDGLMMGTMQRSRTGRIKALVVVGANEGILPQEKADAGLFGNEEKELFNDRGIRLCKVDAVRLMEERMGIYRNLSKPDEELYVSCALADAEGNQIKPSPVFNKLREIFPDVPVERDVLNGGEQRELINGAMSGLRHMTEAFQSVSEGGRLDEGWQQMADWIKKEKPETLQPIINGLSFTNRQETLGHKAADELFKKDPSGDLSVSPSRLERFSRCPFSHFAAYGLKPEERRIFEVAPREIGDIYHQCLMELTERLTLPGVDITDPASPWMTITDDEIKSFVRETVSAQLKGYREGLFDLGNEEKYRGSRVMDTCEKVCRTIIEQVRAGSIKECRFEVPFGRGAGAPIKPIEVKLERETIYIEGKIDRVDYLPGDRVKIIDYKTGNESFSGSEAAAGYRLQLMLYLEASMEEKRRPAGVFYFNISEPMIDMSAKAVNEEEIAEKIKKSFKLNGVIVDDPDVIRNVAGDFTGYSEILPLRKGKEGISATGSEGLLSEEDFEILCDAVNKKVREICADLADGKIDIHPMKTGDRSACTYCSYKGICRFDTVFDGCSYNII